MSAYQHTRTSTAVHALLNCSRSSKEPYYIVSVPYYLQLCGAFSPSIWKAVFPKIYPGQQVQIYLEKETLNINTSRTDDPMKDTTSRSHHVASVPGQITCHLCSTCNFSPHWCTTIFSHLLSTFSQSSTEACQLPSASCRPVCYSMLVCVFRLLTYLDAFPDTQHWQKHLEHK